MATRVLDTNIVSYLVKSHPWVAAYRVHLDGYDHAISFMTYAELLAWGALSNWGPARWQILSDILAGMKVLESDPLTALCWAEIRVRRRARPMSVGDCWIAATAVAYGLELVTHNPADFAGVPGLVVVTAGP